MLTQTNSGRIPPRKLPKWPPVEESDRNRQMRGRGYDGHIGGIYLFICFIKFLSPMNVLFKLSN